jgi:hypothetical protein
MSHAIRLSRLVNFAALVGVLSLASCTPLLDESVPGRLLLYSGNTVELSGVSYTFKRSVYELKAGSAHPRKVFDLAPLSTSFDWFYSKPIAVSFNGQYALFEPNLLVNLANGNMTDLPISENPNGFPVTKASFSLDDRYLAYATEGGIHVIDINNNQSQMIFKGQCAWYSFSGYGAATTVRCGAIGLPLWVDPNTLAFNYFNGEMPYEYDATAVFENSVAVRMVNGENLVTLNERLNVYDDQFIYDQFWDQQSSSTIIVGWPPDINWVDTSDLLQGIINPRPINIDRPYYLLPGGQYLLQAEQPWRLIELRTGTITSLGTNYKIVSFQRCVWSPDRMSVACICYRQMNGNSGVLLIIPLSDSVENVVMNWEDQRWYLLAWVP